ncbi:hypothetical protein QR680_007136 [Steinernema hermaphroditum]|uniref:Uncharacterized protein n=1 Tax=Steinernema hermaphroditum TaxID=289476 RepID=A0AA39LYL7_9BILA|nr:hypothetical protein QR680_007136 [Steinernema hermaphroditum]
MQNFCLMPQMRHLLHYHTHPLLQVTQHRAVVELLRFKVNAIPLVHVSNARLQKDFPNAGMLSELLTGLMWCIVAVFGVNLFTLTLCVKSPKSPKSPMSPISPTSPEPKRDGVSLLAKTDQTLTVTTDPDLKERSNYNVDSKAK